MYVYVLHTDNIPWHDNFLIGASARESSTQDARTRWIQALQRSACRVRDHRYYYNFIFIIFVVIMYRVVWIQKKKIFHLLYVEFRAHHPSSIDSSFKCFYYF